MDHPTHNLQVDKLSTLKDPSSPMGNLTVMGLEKEGMVLMEEIRGPKGVGEEGEEWEESGDGAVGGDKYVDLHHPAELLEELATVIAGGKGDGDAIDPDLAIER